MEKDGMAEKEKNVEVFGTFVARLGDLGLGNPDGIPSVYAGASNEALQEVAEQLQERLVDVQDETALSCIDGRHTNENADHSPAALRYRRVGGSASNYGVALNAGAAVVDTFGEEETIGEHVAKVDALVAEKTGFERSAHLGGCGGANGELTDDVALYENPAVLNTVKAVMQIPAVAAYLEADWDDDSAEIVRQNAGKTAELLRVKGWEGQAYVDGVAKSNPHGVEDLEVDHDDEKFHGHKENTLTIIIGDKTLEGDDDFVWNLKASKEVAQALSEGGDEDAYVRALIAELGKHVAVANRLPGKDTPVMLLQSEYAKAV